MNAKSVLLKGSHPAFQPPSDSQIKIWRYMAFTQFVSILERRGLLFTRADLFEDKFEGTMSRPLYEFLEQHSGDPQQHSGLLRLIKGWSFMNGWHMNECESAAMWKIYPTAKESVCVQTTYARLRRVLAEDVYIGMIKYISYERDKIPAGNTFWPLTFKRRSFEHERELRAVWSAIHMVSAAGPAVASGYEYQPSRDTSVWKEVLLQRENVVLTATRLCHPLIV